MSWRSAGIVFAAALLLSIAAYGPRTAGGVESPQTTAPTQPQSVTRVRPERRPTTRADRIAPSVLPQVRALLAEATELSPGDRGAEDELRLALEALLTDDNAAVIFASLSDAEHATELGFVVFGRWANADPIGAARWLARQPNPMFEQAYALANAAIVQPARIEIVERELPPGETRDEFLSSACRLVTPRDVTRAAEIAGRISPGLTRMTALLALADDWSQRDPASVGAWIAAEPDTTLRDELVRVAAVAQTSKDPVAALEWALTSTASAEGGERAIEAICSQWSDFAPEAAQRFAALLHPSGIGPVAVGSP